MAIIAIRPPFSGLGHGVVSTRARYLLRSMTAKLIFCLFRLPWGIQLPVPVLNPLLGSAHSLHECGQFARVECSATLPCAVILAE